MRRALRSSMNWVDGDMIVGEVKYLCWNRGMD